MKDKVLKSQSLWSRAKKIIPGGNGLLSKRPERYASDIWPVYYEKAKGCVIWDIDGNEYIDMAQNGIGTSILGYSDDDVNAAVSDCLTKSINTTLNAPEEVELAEMILKLNPKMDMVKFAKGGGEAMSMAVRIARAASNKDTIAFSGYHGWSDWYIASNLSSGNNLDQHLLPGLNPIGVPKGLKGTAIPFEYDNIDEFKKVINSNDCGVVVIEGARYDLPSSEFVNYISNECSQRGIILIVDEITSGFRINNSGVYNYLDYEPDIVVYGKAIANGFPMSVICGKSKVMKSASDTFMSSTMWTERVGFVASLATINKFTKHKVHEHLLNMGSKIKDIWIHSAKDNHIDIKISNFLPLVTFSLQYGEQNNNILTLFIQEMLRRGFIATSSVYVTYAHTDSILEKYETAINEVFAILGDAIKKNKILDHLESNIRSDMFKRLTSK